MPAFQTTLLSLLLASTALAAPKHQHLHKHRTGTGAPSGTGGPYGYGNSTGIYPTGTGTGIPWGTSSVAVTTVIVSPLPAPVSTDGAGAASDTCGPATVTVTAANTVTVTVGGESSTAAASFFSSAAVSSYGYGNATSVGPTAYPSGTGAPIQSSGNVFHQKSINPWTSALVIPSSSAAAVAPSSSTSTSVSSASSTSTTTSSTSTAPIYAAPMSSTTVVASSSVASSAPASSTMAPTTVTDSSAGGLSGAKRGIVYNTASLLAPLTAATGAPISWAYNWASTSGGLPSNYKFVPMLWGTNTNGWTANAEAAIAAGADSVMAFNEPDQPTMYGGSQIAPGDAATLYKAQMAPLAGKALLGGPAVSNGNTTTPTLLGVPWLEQFLTACNGCPIDFMPLHWYGWNGGTAAEQATVFQQYVTAFAQQVEAAGGPSKFWVTEFAALPISDPQMNADFLAIVLPWLDSQASMVERYSFFMASDGDLLSGSGLSASGQAYTSDT